MNEFDVIIVGGGVIGLSAAYNYLLASPKSRVLVLERFGFFNDQGSSNDVCRFFRTMYTEDYMMKMSIDTLPLWTELENKAQLAEKLILMTGLINFGDTDYVEGPEGNVEAPIANLKKYGLDYTVFDDPKDVEKLLGMTNLSEIPNFKAVFAPDNGVINVPLTLRTLYSISAKWGAILKDHCRVDSLKVEKGGVTVVSGTTTYTAKKVILTMGAYTNDVLRPFMGKEINMDIWEMIYAYYKYDKTKSPLSSLWFQLRESKQRETDLFYGIPEVPWGIKDHVRLAVDYGSVSYKNYVPRERPSAPTPRDLDLTREFVASHMPGVESYPAFSGSCLAPNTPDNNFVLDFVPETGENVVVFCAGWAMKYVPLIGKLLTQLCLTGTVEDKFKEAVSHFKIDRKGILASPLDQEQQQQQL